MFLELTVVGMVVGCVLVVLACEKVRTVLNRNSTSGKRIISEYNAIINGEVDRKSVV